MITSEHEMECNSVLVNPFLFSLSLKFFPLDIAMAAEADTPVPPPLEVDLGEPVIDYGKTPPHLSFYIHQL